MSLGSTEMETLRAAMKPKTMVIAYWADSELAFIDFTRKLCESAGVRLSLVKIAHEPNWFSENKSLLRNGAHLARIFSRIIALGLYGRVVSFGTNSNRILFLFSWLFKNVYYVYNELPALSKFSPAAWIDRAVFRFARHVSVSTVERAEFIKQAYRLERPIFVLENIAFTDIPATTKRQRNGAILFSGSITSKRFNDSDIDKISELIKHVGQRIDVYGEVAGDISSKFSDLIQLRGKVSHGRMLEVMQDYEYGLLSYYMEEPNYDLCAPLKLYEYVAYGCKVISLNRNTGLVALAKRFPALISFAG
jgi:hypothetical protein